MDAAKRATLLSDRPAGQPGSSISHPPGVNVRSKASGRISLLRELGGKDRCFAIPSVYTQYALYPVHLALFELLRAIPSDFTHDQSKFRMLVSSGNWGARPKAWCYDLTSATDVFPLLIESMVIDSLFPGITVTARESGFLSSTETLGMLWASTIRRGP